MQVSNSRIHAHPFSFCYTSKQALGIVLEESYEDLKIGETVKESKRNVTCRAKTGRVLTVGEGGKSDERSC